MARIRSIKPEFFQHEALFDAEARSQLPLRVAFIGLWTAADKMGRFEWRPRQLKLNVLPYDDVDFSAVLSALEASGFIRRYVVEGKTYGDIPAWEKHQHPNVREPDSTIPAPASGDAARASTIPEPYEDGTSMVPVPDRDSAGKYDPGDAARASTIPEQCQSVGKGREGKGKEGNGTARASTCTALARATPGLDPVAWEAWIAYRKGIKKPLREVSLEAAARELAAFGADQAAVVEQSKAQGWQGLFALKSKPSTSGERRWE